VSFAPYDNDIVNDVDSNDVVDDADDDDADDAGADDIDDANDTDNVDNVNDNDADDVEDNGWDTKQIIRSLNTSYILKVYRQQGGFFLGCAVILGIEILRLGIGFLIWNRIDIWLELGS
jgi:hypothetical protein